MEKEREIPLMNVNRLTASVSGKCGNWQEKIKAALREMPAAGAARTVSEAKRVHTLLLVFDPFFLLIP